MTDCIFCKIASGEIPADVVFKDEQITAFRDIKPAAKVHILVIPNDHIESMQQVTKGDADLLGHLFHSVKVIAAEQGIADEGYRLIINTGPNANQVVKHLHVHILGGNRLIYPMG